MFNIIFIFFSLQLAIAILLKRGSYKINSQNLLSTPQPFSIIIPFKNEINRILPLLKSINQSAIYHKKDDLFSQIEFIFIDDHSTDNSVEFIVNEIDIKCKIIRLNNTFGKKYAIKKGVEEALYSKILTLDADVSFNINYLDSILNINCNGLCILPVEIQAKSLLQNIYSVQFLFLQQLTFGLSNYTKPTLCNGANLLFTKSTFFESQNIRQDATIQSGDDMYLLKAVDALNIPISTFNSKIYQVKTNSPKNFISVINQSVRWAKKPQSFSSKIGGLFIITSNILMLICIYLAFTYSILFVIPLILKLISEILSATSPKHILYITLHQIYYPFYLCILAIKLLFPLPKWR